MSSFIVFTMDQRATRFERGNGVGVDEFMLLWRRSLNDNDRPWPLAYGLTDDGTKVVVTFNPMTICSVTTEVPSRPTKKEKGK